MLLLRESLVKKMKYMSGNIVLMLSFMIKIYNLKLNIWGLFVWGGCRVWVCFFNFLKGAEAEPCELMYSVQMCAQGHVCFAWLKNVLSLPNTKSVETNKKFFAYFSGLWLTLLLCKLRQPNRTSWSEFPFVLQQSLTVEWFSFSVLLQPGRYTCGSADICVSSLILFNLGLLLIVACCFVFSCKNSNLSSLWLLPFLPSSHRKRPGNTK